MPWIGDCNDWPDSEPLSEASPKTKTSPPVVWAWATDVAPDKSNATTTANAHPVRRPTVTIVATSDARLAACTVLTPAVFSSDSRSEARCWHTGGTTPSVADGFRAPADGS